MSTAEPKTASPSAPGRTGIGERYRSLQVIGRGGMGRVEVALERSEGRERIVALKRLLPEGAHDKRLADMFLREARLAALLSHPNVVHAFEFGELDGEFFLAMEYVEGEPLSRVLATARQTEGRLLSALTAHILAETCEGLHAAHELRDESGTILNVVHRDVSPHNVMVAYEGNIKLLDFGVAKIDAEGALTKTGEVKGKVAYMSPEQAMGDALDRRSDLYSIGAMLFECVAGRRMWLGTDMEVLRQLALDEPPRLENLAPDAPGEMCALYTRLVTRLPTGRPATAKAVADELRALTRKMGAHEGPQDLKELMTRLFHDDRERRRRDLSRALEGAPQEIVALPQSSTRPAPRRRKIDKRVLSSLALVILVVAAGVALSKPRPSRPRPRPRPRQIR